MRPTVFLFDIDGTLVLTGGAGRKAMRAAFAEIDAERGAAALDFPFAGMTDRAIARIGLRTLAAAEAAAGEAPIAASAIDRVRDAYLEHLAAELTRADAYQVLPGVVAALELVATLPDVAIGLGTGNVRKGAYAKLARGSLDGAFAFGGFGCDAEDRTELLRVGAERGAAALGVPLTSCRIVVIGDTPKDVAAAHGIGAECIGVGTGGFEPRELIALGARTAFDTLEAEGVHEALREGAR